MKRAFVAIALAAIAMVAWWLLSSQFGDATTEEELPPGISLEDRLLLEKINALTPRKIESMTATQRTELQQSMEAVGARLPERTISDPLPPELTVIARGNFRDADATHRGSGTAAIERQRDGAYLLRLEHFSVTNSPGLVVHLVRDSQGDETRGFVELGALKGNRGNQNYDIPEDIDVSQFKSVVIMSEPFDIPFSIARFES